MTMSLSVARPIVSEPLGFSGVAADGRKTWIIFVARLPTSGGLAWAGAIRVCGWTLGGGADGGGLPGYAAAGRCPPLGGYIGWGGAGAVCGWLPGGWGRIGADCGGHDPPGWRAGCGCDGRGAPDGWTTRIDAVRGGRPANPACRPTSKVSRGPSGLPMLMLWPSWMSTTGTRRPLTKVPFSEPLSIASHRPWSKRSNRCAREISGWVMRMSARRCVGIRHTEPSAPEVLLDSSRQL